MGDKFSPLLLHPAPLPLKIYGEHILRFLIVTGNTPNKHFLVDLTQCHLRTVENVFTWMSCTGMCKNINGVNDIYNFGPNGFQIYPHRARDETLTLDDVKKYDMVLHYQVTGEC